MLCRLDVADDNEETVRVNKSGELQKKCCCMNVQRQHS